MQSIVKSRSLVAGLIAAVAACALWGALFAVQPAQAVESQELAAGTVAVDNQSKKPTISANDLTLYVGETKSLVAGNGTDGQSGTWKWKATKNASLVKLSNTSKNVAKVKGLKAGKATLKVTYTTKSGVAASATVAVTVKDKTPKLTAKGATVVVAGKAKSVKATNSVKQSGTWQWKVVKNAACVKLTNAKKATATVKGLKGGKATLQVTFTTPSGVSKSKKVTVKVNGIKSTAVATSKYLKGIVFKRTGVNTVRVEKTKGNKDIKLSTIKIPNTIKLGDAKGCTYTYKVTAIKGAALNKQHSTKTIIVGDNVKTIGKHAFCADWKLKKLVLGKGVTKLSPMIVHINNKSLKTITIKSTKLKKANVKNCFKSNKYLTTVKVPASKVKAYKKIFTKANCGAEVTVTK